MIRMLHRWPGLLALALLTLLAISGAALSVFPAIERLSAPQADAGQTVAELATLVAERHPGVEQIRRAPSGRITAYWFDGGTPGAAVIDPSTGNDIAPADPAPSERWLTNLHRSLFLDDTGRLVTAGGAAAMLILALSGVMLVARRTGGWRRWLTPVRGPTDGRLHVEIARFVVLGLVLSSVTALWMTASTFDLLPDAPLHPPMPERMSEQTGFPPADMDILRSTSVMQLRELSFPYAGDVSDVFTLKTGQGTGYIDQGTGELLAWSNATAWQRLSEIIYMLHTGQGATALGLILGAMALGVPAMGATGVLVWMRGRRGRPRLAHNSPASQASNVVLVGSEGGSTWSFAATLAKELRAPGQSVHIAPMKGFDPRRFPGARRFFILAATYGEGDAPASAEGFIGWLDETADIPAVPLAVLGFGDRSFPAFCAFAEAVAKAAHAKGWSELLPFDTVDRQSPQDFARWGRALGAVLGIELELAHQPVVPATETLTLVSRRNYGADVQAPAAILRFATPSVTLWQRLTGRGFSHFQAGDLLGVLPEGSDMPRLYSLASSRGDGFLEIIVRRHAGGLCSSQLTALEPGSSVQAFLRRNSRFVAGAGRTPLILIGAGTGIGPLAGIVRANRRRRPIHLFFGMRHPGSDFFYGEEMPRWQAQGRIARLVTAISRGARPHYVQDALRAEAVAVTRLIRDGARVMVCGGRDMAAGVADAMTEILAPVGMSPATLKAEGRYVEDVY